MKKITLVLILVPLSISDLSAQYTFGDIEVPSFEYIFDSDNRELWKEKNHKGLYEFKIQNSTIWNKKDIRVYI